MRFLFLPLFVFVSLFANEEYYYSDGKKVYLTPVKSKLRALDKSIDLYTDQYGLKVGVKNEILVKIKKNVDIDDLMKKYDSLILIKKVYEDLYLIRNESNQTTIELSNRLYEDDDTYFAHPNFVRESTKR